MDIKTSSQSVGTDTVAQELEENGKREQQIKGETTAVRLKEQNEIKKKTAAYCLMKARADHVSCSKSNSVKRSPGVAHPTVQLKVH